MVSCGMRTGAAALIPFAVLYCRVYLSFDRSNPNFLASLLVSAMSEAPVSIRK